MFAPVLIEIIKYPDTGISNYAPSVLFAMQQYPQVLAQITPQLLDMFFENENVQFISKCLN